MVGATDGGLALIDPDTGALVWKDRFDFLLEGVSTAPVVSGRDVYLSQMLDTYTGYAFRWTTMRITRSRKTVGRN